MEKASSENQKSVIGLRSLHWFLAIVVFASIAIPAVITGSFLILENYQRSLEKESSTTVEGYADILEAGMKIPLWNVSPHLGQPIINNLVVDTSVVSVVVKTDSDEIFLSFSRKYDEERPTNIVTVTRPVEYSGEQIGEIELVYSLERAHAQVAAETKLLTIIIFTQLLISLATISFVLHKRVLSPLKKIQTAAEGIAGGDLKTSIPALQDDEFGTLSQQLESMRGSLETNFMELEERVDMRTQELQSVNHVLQASLNQLKQTQDSLVQSEKLAALGSLVAGVAHELNTPIGNGLTVATSLRESCEFMKKEVEEGLTRAALDKFILDMEDGSHLVSRNLLKASELVSSFKQVAVDQTSAQRRKFSVNDLLHETRLTVSPLFKRTPFVVDIEIEEDAELNSYPGPLGQVVTNLLTNAIVHAFDGRDRGRVLMTVHKLPEGLELIVADNGLGMSEESQTRIFDPFYTTKIGEGGNGLGMHIVHNIITGMLGGKINFSSREGVGTRFIIYLPYDAPEDDNKDEGGDSLAARDIKRAG